MTDQPEKPFALTEEQKQVCSRFPGTVFVLEALACAIAEPLVRQRDEWRNTAASFEMERDAWRARFDELKTRVTELESLEPAKLAERCMDLSSQIDANDERIAKLEAALREIHGQTKEHGPKVIASTALRGGKVE